MKIVFILMSLFIPIACQLLETTEVIEIAIPREIPEILADSDYYWLFKGRSVEGDVYSLVVDREVKSVFATVERGIIRAFTLQPMIKMRNFRDFIVFPAGFIYEPGQEVLAPYSFRWDIGFEGRILLNLASFFDLERLNIPKLLETVSEVAREESHWIIDDKALIENMISGDFRIYDIRKKRMRTIEIPLPKGEWFGENPLDDKLISPSDSISVKIDVPVGTTFFYNKSPYVLEIEMKSSGKFEYMVY